MCRSRSPSHKEAPLEGKISRTLPKCYGEPTRVDYSDTVYSQLRIFVPVAGTTLRFSGPKCTHSVRSMACLRDFAEASSLAGANKWLAERFC